MWLNTKLALATWPFGAHPLTAVAATAADLNYDGLVVTADPEQETAASLSAALDENQLALFALAAPEVDLAHPAGEVQGAAIAVYRRLLALAADLACPLLLVSGPRRGGRPLSPSAEERQRLETAVRQIAVDAAEQGVRIAIDVRNRYESVFLHTVSDALALVTAVGLENVGVALSAFHMNIEEQDAGGAIQQAGDRLWLYRMADSNRQAIGRGHLKLGTHLWALEEANYAGPIVIECLPPGADPFNPEPDAVDISLLETYLQESRSWF